MKLSDGGEILVKTSRGTIVGPKDAQGWFHTGDVGRWVDGRLQVLDRLGACVKLSNGEFFRPQRAEAALEGACPSVDKCALIARVGDRVGQG